MIRGTVQMCHIHRRRVDINDPVRWIIARWGHPDFILMEAAKKGPENPVFEELDD